MNEEIKFRLVRNGKVVGYEKLVPVDNLLYWAYRSVGEKMFSLHSTINHDKKDRFTGITDMNGTEVYQRDIIKCDLFENNMEVIWMGNLMSFGFRDGVEVRYLPPSMIRVIGNIHENPELLNQNITSDSRNGYCASCIHYKIADTGEPYCSKTPDTEQFFSDKEYGMEAPCPNYEPKEENI